jgi:hypothetical protein
MWAALTSVYVSAIVIVGALAFRAVELFEPNPRAALVLKCMILAAGGAAIANHLLPEGCSQPSQNLRKSDEYGSMDFPHNLRRTSARSEGEQIFGVPHPIAGPP